MVVLLMPLFSTAVLRRGVQRRRGPAHLHEPAHANRQVLSIGAELGHGHGLLEAEVVQQHLAPARASAAGVAHDVPPHCHRADRGSHRLVSCGLLCLDSALSAARLLGRAPLVDEQRPTVLVHADEQRAVRAEAQRLHLLEVLERQRLARGLHQVHLHATRKPRAPARAGCFLGLCQLAGGLEHALVLAAPSDVRPARSPA